VRIREQITLKTGHGEGTASRRYNRRAQRNGESGPSRFRIRAPVPGTDAVPSGRFACERECASPNLHAYHYAGNNPVKLVDPDGEYLAIVGDEDTAQNVLDKINSASFYKYEMQKLGDDSYLLYRSENSEVNRDGSRSYSRIIDALCYDTKSLNLISADENFLPEKGQYSEMNDLAKVTMCLTKDSKTYFVSVDDTKVGDSKWNTSTLIVFNADTLSEKNIIHGLITTVLPLSINLGKQKPANLERQVKFDLFLSRIIKN
jgi:hypothetical protein